MSTSGFQGSWECSGVSVLHKKHTWQVLCKVKVCTWYMSVANFHRFLAIHFTSKHPSFFGDTYRSHANAIRILMLDSPHQHYFAWSLLTVCIFSWHPTDAAARELSNPLFIITIGFLRGEILAVHASYTLCMLMRQGVHGACCYRCFDTEPFWQVFNSPPHWHPNDPKP